MLPLSFFLHYASIYLMRRGGRVRGREKGRIIIMEKRERERERQVKILHACSMQGS